MGPPVRYIETTHDYYRRLGYPIPYKYARFDTHRSLPWPGRSNVPGRPRGHRPLTAAVAGLLLDEEHRLHRIGSGVRHGRPGLPRMGRQGTCSSRPL
jgi:hypothetical protein